MIAKIEGKTKFLGKCLFIKPVFIPDNIFWTFSNLSGSSFNGVNVTYDQSLTDVQLNWGDETSPENINSGVNNNHTLS
jgi:hypothetical protein